MLAQHCSSTVKDLCCKRPKATGLRHLGLPVPPLSGHRIHALWQAMPLTLHCNTLVGTSASLICTSRSSPAPFYIQLIYVRVWFAFSFFALQVAFTNFNPENELKSDFACGFLIHNLQYLLSTFSRTSVLAIKKSQEHNKISHIAI